MPRRSEAEKIYDEMSHQDSGSGELEQWQEYWHEAGPVRFAEECLTAISESPPFPNWQQFQETKWCEGCQSKHPRFHNDGSPYHVILSDEQKGFLVDLWHGLPLALISAGRGSGKTVVLAVYNCWVLCTVLRVQISALAGSGKQSKLMQKYINQWRIDIPMIKKALPRSLRGVEPKIETSSGGDINFLPCSTTAVRGPHVPIVEIDEACEAESKSEDGADAVDAIWYQVVGKKNSQIILTSTTHYIFGKFYEYLTNPAKYGFKIYVWSIAKHITGKPPEETFKDRNPTHWLPAVWWVTQSDIEMLRKKSSDSEWLCEALGRPSLASGQVFSKDDMDSLVCNKCPECYPYRWDNNFKCPLIDLFKLGDRENPTRQIIDRRSGFDYGDPAPCALTLAGRKGQLGFILYSDEMRNASLDELEHWVTSTMDKWNCDTFVPDPSIGGKDLSKKLDDKGYAVYMIGEAEKEERVLLVKRIVERHLFIIPQAFWKLITSMRQLAWDKEGKIRKFNDHSFDTTQYITVGWDDMTDEFEGVGGEGVFGAVLGTQYEQEFKDDDGLFKGVKIW